MTIMVVGDNIVDVFDELSTASIGGNCLNVAVNLQRSGVLAQYIGNVGDDELGAAVLDELSSAGLDIEHVQTIRDRATGYALIHLVEGERHFGEFDRGAGVVRLGEAQWKTLNDADLIHTSYSSQLENEVDRLSRIAPLSFDFDSHIDDDYSRALVPYVAHGFFSAAGRSEATIDSHAEALIAAGMTTVTMTRADRGALHYQGSGKWCANAESIVVTDTLGAGDAFIAGVLAGIANSTPIEDMLRTATAMASAVCTTVGSLGLYVDPGLVRRVEARR
jgi:fructoselysine 6-kinase